MAKKPRIPTTASTTGLNQAFGSLAMPDLPPGPPETASPSPAPPSVGQRLILRKEKAHRGGKTVVVVDGFTESTPPEEIASLAARLRQACGCGGTVRGTTVEIQGDQPARVRELLEAWGFTVGGVR